MKAVTRTVLVKETYYVEDESESPITDAREGMGDLISCEILEEEWGFQ